MSIPTDWKNADWRWLIIQLINSISSINSPMSSLSLIGQFFKDKIRSMTRFF